MRRGPGRCRPIGPSGWIGVWLDGKVDRELLTDAYRMTAPKKLLARFDERS